MIRWSTFVRFFVQAIPAIVFFSLWELASGGDRSFRFLFGSPALVIAQIGKDLRSGALLWHFWTTGIESLSGLLLGSIIGSSIGLLLWLSPLTAGMSRPYIAAISAVPSFSLAPMMIFWFGTGIFAKIMMATLATVFVAIVQSYEGAQRADAEFIGLTRSFGANRWQSFRLVVIPATGAWIFVSCRLNVGFAILGAFVGEFISSDRGIGHYILRASGLYDVPRVLTGVVCLVVLSYLLTLSVRAVERFLAPWLRNSE